MSTYPTNGYWEDDPDWQAALDYAADQRRYAPWHDDAAHTDYHPLRDQRHACSNPECSALTEALFCSEACREHTEGPDHEDACEPEEESTAAGRPESIVAICPVYTPLNRIPSPKPRPVPIVL